MFAMLLFVAVNIYFTKKKDERNLWNDLAGILIFALAGMGSITFLTALLMKNTLGGDLSNIIFFIGTTLYVKSMMRERKIHVIFGHQ